MSNKPYIATRELVIFPETVTPIFIGREASLKSLDEAINNFDGKLVLSMQKDTEMEEPKLPKDVYTTGVLVKIIQSVEMPNGNIKILVESKSKVVINKFEKQNGVIFCEYEKIFLRPISESKSQALRKKVLEKFSEYAKKTQKILPDIVQNINGIEDVEKVFNLICTHLPIKSVTKQEILEITDIEKCALKILEVLSIEMEVFVLDMNIESRVKEQMAELQKNYYLREKIKVIKDELGEEIDNEEDAQELDGRIKNSKIPKDLKEKLLKEVSRLRKMPDFSSEASVIRSYVETVLDLPWSKSTKDEIDIEKAKEILDEDHYGLEEVKERILEFLAVKKLNNTLKGSIICLVGPPGVGKTSLAHSVARAMNRKFTRISLGGVRDEAEIDLSEMEETKGPNHIQPAPTRAGRVCGHLARGRRRVVHGRECRSARLRRGVRPRSHIHDAQHAGQTRLGHRRRIPPTRQKGALRGHLDHAARRRDDGACRRRLPRRIRGTHAGGDRRLPPRLSQARLQLHDPPAGHRGRRPRPPRPLQASPLQP